eukprot:scaffold88635_cov64-Phaeocystis_antarctica.AAC.1
MASTPKLGSSELHTDCHHRGRLLLDRFRQPPPPSLAVPVITAEAAAACAETAQAICARETPVVVRGCTDVFRTTRWSSAEQLVEHYGDVPFELAADVTLSLRDYVRYAADAEADYPYYLVERRFEGERVALLQDYAPPALFDDDLLSQVPGSKRARYWLVGGERSGTALHADPLCSSAWNACACGRKLWAFLPPDADLAAAGLRTRADGGERRPAVWFADELEAASSLPGYQLCLQEASYLLSSYQLCLQEASYLLSSYQLCLQEASYLLGSNLLTHSLTRSLALAHSLVHLLTRSL